MVVIAVVVVVVVGGRRRGRGSGSKAIFIRVSPAVKISFSRRPRSCSSSSQ